MTVFTRTWNAAYEADPADSDAASGGAQDIRFTKIDVGERLVVDHSWAGDVDDGTHKKVTFVDPLVAKPTQQNDETYLYAKDVSATSELFYEDEAGNEVQLTEGGEALGGVEPGTVMIFYQASAPTGWTDQAISGNTLRCVTQASASGGTTGGVADINTSLAHVHTGPSHTHSVSGTANAYTGATWQAVTGGGWWVPQTSHSHTVSGTANAAGTGNTGAMSTGLTTFSYINCVVASKD